MGLCNEAAHTRAYKPADQCYPLPTFILVFDCKRATACEFLTSKGQNRPSTSFTGHPVAAAGALIDCLGTHARRDNREEVAETEQI
uniref:Uncharacterized protein n=1 Tax=Knipowitschia caucasica TaxID=637954 RepID=A0AAV2JE60_KNICA